MEGEITNKLATLSTEEKFDTHLDYRKILKEGQWPGLSEPTWTPRPADVHTKFCFVSDASGYFFGVWFVRGEQPLLGYTSKNGSATLAYVTARGYKTRKIGKGCLTIWSYDSADTDQIADEAGLLTLPFLKSD